MSADPVFVALLAGLAGGALLRDAWCAWRYGQPHALHVCRVAINLRDVVFAGGALPETLITRNDDTGEWEITGVAILPRTLWDEADCA